MAVAAEREEFGSDGFGGGDEPDGWAPPVSRQRGRGGRGKIGWAKPKEEKGARGGVAGPQGRKEEGGKEIPFPFMFFIPNFQLKF